MFVRTKNREALRLIVALTSALHRYGAPTHRIEDMVLTVCRQLGVDAQLFATPTSVMISLGRGAAQQVRFLRTNPDGFDLGRLCQADAVARELSGGRLAVGDALARLDELADQSSPWSAPVRALSFVLASVTTAIFFGGGTHECAVAGLIGGVVGLLAEASARYPAVARSFVASASLSSGFIALALLPAQSWLVAATAGLILLVPGFTLTVALTELATDHLASGSARLAGAGSTLLSMGVGVLLGGELAAVVTPPLHATLQAPSAGLEVVSLIVGGAAFGILLNVPPRDLVAVIIASAVAYGVALQAGTVASPFAAAFAGGFAITLMSSIYERGLSRPGALLRVPGVLMLVPGSMGFRSMAALGHGDTLSGIETAFSTMMVGASIAAGVVAATTLLPPHRPIRGPVCEPL